MLMATEYLCADSLELRPLVGRALSVCSCPYNSDSAFRFFYLLQKPWFDTAVPISSWCCDQEP
jgi:hypothetical protein